MQGRQIFVQELGRNQERLLREDTFDAVVDLKKKKTQCESSELRLICGKMRTLARDAAFQIALKYRPKEVRGMSVNV